MPRNPVEQQILSDEGTISFTVDNSKWVDVQDQNVLIDTGVVDGDTRLVVYATEAGIGGEITKKNSRGECHIEVPRNEAVSAEYIQITVTWEPGEMNLYCQPQPSGTFRNAESSL